ncbi:MBL fold metallo-hydrolase [Erwinia typographi]|uniref:MBL fold metallo-hydrolase n=1 Tax=Erwinia typographi TaxID=371042 RepID=UPI000907CF20|nr:MBL fold metallo-hydrolase [Erwinia typographi]
MSYVRTYRIGRALIRKIPELRLEKVPGSFLYPQWKDEHAQQAAATLPACFFSGDFSSLEQSTHSWLLQIDGINMLIDTASGNGKSRPNNLLFNKLDTPFIQHLRAAGVDPEEIDYIFNSHLHVDHVGWNTVMKNGEWQPTFPNARYIFSQKEYDFYRNPGNVKQPSENVFEDSVEPVVSAGLDIRLTDETNFPLLGFKVHYTPGHSYDHLSLSFTSEGETAFFWGDVLHHPVQVNLPEWNSIFCEFPEQSLDSRHKALNFAAQTRATVFTTHFPDSSAGCVERNESGEFRWTIR